MDDLEKKLREILALENGEEGQFVIGHVSGGVAVAAMRAAYGLGALCQRAQPDQD